MKESGRDSSHWTKKLKIAVAGFFFLALLAAPLFSVSVAASSLDGGGGLPKFLTITWEKGPDLPQGFQDSSGGIIRHMLITVGGYSSGQTIGVVNKRGKYPHGSLKKTWALNLDMPQSGWLRLPDFPGEARQGLFGAVVRDRLYTWGGFSHLRSDSYRDGYRLSKEKGQWQWDRLPDLPWPIVSGGMVAIGSKIYLMGGADYAAEHVYTNTDRNGKVKRLGARLLVFDTNNPESSWKELPACPGTPRFTQAVAAVGGMIYVIGGAAGNDNASGKYATIVDNWRYDPATEKWSRLPDTPIASGNFPSGGIVFENRYIVLVGGFQYENVLNPDGTMRKPYGNVFRHYKNNRYASDVFVFDTKTNKFGFADPLPLNNDGPLTVLQGRHLYLIGGETGGAVIQGEYFGHKPDLFLVGTIQKTTH